MTEFEQLLVDEAWNIFEENFNQDEQENIHQGGLE